MFLEFRRTHGEKRPKLGQLLIHKLPNCYVFMIFPKVHKFRIRYEFELDGKPDLSQTHKTHFQFY